MHIDFRVIESKSLRPLKVDVTVPAKSCERDVPEPDNVIFTRPQHTIEVPLPEWNVELSRQRGFANKIRLGRRTLVEVARLTPLWTQASLKELVSKATLDDRWRLAPGNFFRDKKNGSEFLCNARSILKAEHKIAESRLQAPLPAYDKLKDLSAASESIWACLEGATGWSFNDVYLGRTISVDDLVKSNAASRSYRIPSVDAALPFGLGRSGSTLVHSPDNIIVSFALNQLASV